MKKKSGLAIGLMSGTSTDGIDAALIAVDLQNPRPTTLISSLFRPYLGSERQLLLDATQPDCSALHVKRADMALGEWLADAVNQLLAEAHVNARDIRVIGSHGHTVAHYPDQHISWQIGNPHVLAQRTGIGVISDFRQRDLLLGGQGAPLVPLYDYVMFHSSGETRVLLNLGGIANLTVLTAGSSCDAVTAWDAGPANMILDGLVMIATQGQSLMDEGGRQMAQGTVHKGLLERWQQHPFFSKPIPKSTGREEFGMEYVQRLWQDGRTQGLSLPDLLATAGELIAQAISRSLTQVTAAPVALIAGGGGTHNAALMEKISRALPLLRPWEPTGAYGVPEDAKEAMAFAYYGWLSLNGVPIHLPHVTGASHTAIMGSYTPGIEAEVDGRYDGL
ncbi:MAG: anhydro-N-acetylmuramic acid kinase [Sulfobacillus thermotolerans]|nr:anhydro-N-acetylmuramic acid kinase [Sulfobacillus thermotolerans]